MKPPDPVTASAAPDLRAVAEALGFEPDNHHNALLCPYCGGERQKVEREVREQLARDFERLAGIRNPDDPIGSGRYSRWATDAADRMAAGARRPRWSTEGPRPTQ